MALGDKIATQGNRLQEMLLNITRGRDQQQSQIRQAIFNQAIQRILKDKEEKSRRDRENTARQQALVKQIGFALAGAAFAPAAAGAAGGAASAGASATTTGIGAAGSIGESLFSGLGLPTSAQVGGANFSFATPGRLAELGL